jgi:hypothetical protein
MSALSDLLNSVLEIDRSADVIDNDGVWCCWGELGGRDQRYPPMPRAIGPGRGARMPPFQVPARFLLVNDLPRTNFMKPALPQVRALFDTDNAAA